MVMEMLITHCSNLLAGDFPLLLSVMLAGLVGSLSHCSVMCAPLVAAQMIDLKSKKQPQTHMAYYHIGRITTYVLLAITAFYVSHWVFSVNMALVAQAMLLIAGGVFITSALLPRKTHHCCSKNTQHITQRIERTFPLTVAYFLRGLLMGLMPCGMIVAVLLMVSTLQNAPEAALAMALFGISTVPVLQLMGMGTLSLQRRFPKTTYLTGRSVMACNGLLLCLIGLNLVSVN